MLMVKVLLVVLLAIVGVIGFAMMSFAHLRAPVRSIDSCTRLPGEDEEF